VSRAKILTLTALAAIGWFAMWRQILAGPHTDWAMPWTPLRGPLVFTVAMLTGWPLQRWILKPPPEGRKP
jgi:hypothetical protein